MRTTINIDDAVLAELRRRSEQEERSMGEVASSLLARALDEPVDHEADEFVWQSRDLGEPLIDYHDKHALWAALDDDAHPR